ncbi:MAG: hypothetical protein V3S74_04145, partial [Alphaproteobacteria bacterium]
MTPNTNLPASRLSMRVFGAAVLCALWPVPAEAATGTEVAIFSATAGALLTGLIGAALAAY